MWWVKAKGAKEVVCHRRRYKYWSMVSSEIAQEMWEENWEHVEEAARMFKHARSCFFSRSGILYLEHHRPVTFSVAIAFHSKPSTWFKDISSTETVLWYSEKFYPLAPFIQQQAFQFSGPAQDSPSISIFSQGFRRQFANKPRQQRSSWTNSNDTRHPVSPRFEVGALQSLLRSSPIYFELRPVLSPRAFRVRSVNKNANKLLQALSLPTRRCAVQDLVTRPTRRGKGSQPSVNPCGGS
ncbi:hypothetical protein SCHPADRAFT_139411 [Schizopora paradoxa]|uniref:Uncharacterized protein n=1 Tax=Schizopora paradoxa TaxID=27342 RepID=A0A0H2S267_9AGAM|nr:hypothetical protein SCHPADRAFT_139411 [Schizopora paradoxa]